MKKVFITLLFTLPFFSFSQSHTGSFFKPNFSDFAYYTPSKDTLFLEKDNEDAEKIKILWFTDTLIKEPQPVFFMVNSIPEFKAKREDKDWKVSP